MKKFFLVSILCVLLVFLFFESCRESQTDVRKAIEGQLKLYPELHLQDIYKSFFQDEYGPGHLIDEVSSAREYLDYELEEMTSHGRHNAEPCGTGENFLRIPMDLVKDGIIPDSVFFETFLESASSFSAPDITSWKKKWENILWVVESMKLDLPNFEQEKKALADWLDSGETTVHHSRKYQQLYDPHYRIMGKEQWEKLEKTYLQAIK